jgi:DNA-binding response OmpR family regulator
VLVIEDDADARSFVAHAAHAEGYSVMEAATGGQALALLRARAVDVVVLDLGLPDRDGFGLLRDIRRASRASTIVVSGDARVESRVTGLRLGADDYLVKPVAVVEIGARVAAAVRRATGDRADRERVHLGPYVIDLVAHDVQLHGEPVPMTRRELALLTFLVRHPRRAFTRTQLLDAVWQSEPLDVATVTEHVRTLRGKLAASGDAARWIVTVRGVGYRFDP